MKKTGPKPKKLVDGTIQGLPVGRDKTVVPPDQVYELAALYCSDKDIASFFGIKEDTLRYNFAAELTKGRENLKISLRRAMIKNAIANENVTMQIWLSKNILGMSENNLDSDANQPLPWREDLTDDVEIGEYNEEDSEHGTVD